MKILFAKDYEEMSRKAASIIFAQVTLQPDSVLGLATGSSPLGTYRQLADWCAKGELDFSACRAVNLDEYLGLAPDREESYAWFMAHNLFSHINIAPENTYIPDGTNLDVEKESARYNEVIRRLGGVDLQLLGIGHNGHIAFNEPSDSFPKQTHCVDLTPETIEANTRFFAKREDVPTRAYTMGIQSIMGARKLLLIASGAEKAEIVAQMVLGDICPQLPASILQLHPDATVVADAAALAVLLKRAPQLVEGRPL